MGKEERIQEGILSAIDELNEQLPRKQKIRKSVDSVLLGQKEGLDSLGLVNLIVSVEQKIEEDFGLSVSLGLEDAGLGEENPFRTVKTLAKYISRVIEEK